MTIPVETKHKIIQANVTHARKLNRLFIQSIMDEFGFFSESFQANLKRQHSTWRFTKALVTPVSYFYLVIDQAKQPIGYNLVRLSNNQAAFLHWMYVSPDYRQLGIGSDLVKRACQDLKLCGSRNVKLVTYDKMGFYEHLGFIRSGQSLIPIGGVKMQLMELDLK